MADGFVATFDAGSGNDLLTLNAGAGQVDLGTGNDQLVAKSWVGNVSGGAGDDAIRLLGGGEAPGGVGKDAFENDVKSVKFFGDDGNDTFHFNFDKSEWDLFDGGAGFDTLVIHVATSAIETALTAALDLAIPGLTPGGQEQYLDALSLTIKNVEAITFDVG